jgi:hypothetical protein
VLIGKPGVVWGSTAAAALILVAWTPLDLFGTWLGVLACAIVVVVGVEALRRTCLVEAATRT